MTNMTLFDTLIINKFTKTYQFKEFKDMNLDIAMKDMIRYIEKMGGSVEENPNHWKINCPYLWTSSIYKRFKSFGIRPLLPQETQWLAHTLVEPITFEVAESNG